MHAIQLNILDLANTKNLSTLKLREIGELVGEPHPQKIKHHLNHLLKKGLLKQSRDKTVISPVSATDKSDQFISLPILGSANCGQATLLADEYPEGYLQISKSMLPNFQPKEYFALKAVGNSMNRSSINGKSIEDGDYVVIDRRQKNNYQNKYVLSIINGMANIKKFILNSSNNQIILISESSQDYPPIYIHSDDFQSYMINGEITDVIKKPQI